MLHEKTIGKNKKKRNKKKEKKKKKQTENKLRESNLHAGGQFEKVRGETGLNWQVTSLS